MYLISQEDNFLIKPLQIGQREEIACVINCVNKNINETNWYNVKNSMRFMWINYDQMCFDDENLKPPNRPLLNKGTLDHDMTIFDRVIWTVTLDINPEAQMPGGV